MNEMDALQATFAVVDGLDAAFGGGLARLIPEQRAGLVAFAEALAGSPLGGPVAEAVAAIDGGSPLTHHLVALAAGRAALLGAAHDALLASCPGGVTVGAAEVSPAASPSAAQRARMEALQQWLTEVALAGFGQLDPGTLTPALGTVAGLQDTPGLGRLAALATGLLDEWLDHAPTSALPSLPLRRWGDLWSRALLGASALPEEAPAAPVSGRLHVLGAEPRHHDHLVSVVIHGVLEADGARRFTRTTLSAWKVDAIAGVDLWNLLKAGAPALLAAVASPATLEVQGSLSATGALQITQVGSSKPLDPFALDLSGVIYAAPAPRDRHPIQIAVPARDPGVELSDRRASPLLEPETRDVGGVIGLVRWDGAWSLQPLLVRTRKGKLLGAAETLAAADKVKSDARAVLSERASKLLRTK